MYYQTLFSVYLEHTLTGCAKVLKKRNPNLKVFAVEPSSSPVLSGGKPGPHVIQGIGAGFIPNVLDMSQIDQVIRVHDQDAMEIGRRLAKRLMLPFVDADDEIEKSAGCSITDLFELYGEAEFRNEGFDIRTIILVVVAVVE